MADTVSSVFAAVPDPQLFESDVNIIAQAMLTGFQAGYQAATGVPLTLGAADPRRYELLYQADLISQSYAAGNWVSKQNLLKYAVGPNLDTLGSFWGEMGLRLAPAQATCDLQFSMQSPSGLNVTIPAGTSVATSDPNNLLVFATLQDAVIVAGNLFVITTGECTTAGEIANGLDIGSINVLQNWSQPYVITAANSSATSGGSDLETDDHYRIRLYKLPKGLSTCGTKESYEFFALSANPSIAQVSVYSDPGISGTVILTPLMAGGGIPTQTEMDQIYAICSGDNNRPLSDQVIVSPPTGYAYQVVVSAALPIALAAQESTLLESGYNAIDNFVLNEKQSLGGYIDPGPLANAFIDLGFIDVQVTEPTFSILADNQQPILTDDPLFNYAGLI